MRKHTWIFAAVFLLLCAPTTRAPAEIDTDGPLIIVTAEYTPYQRLIEPEVVELFTKYHVSICLCVREDQLNNDLDNLYRVYEENEITILFWPLLPHDQGLWVNKHNTAEYLDYLDVVFGWADAHGHEIEALVVDIEPSYQEPSPLWKKIRRLAKDLDKESFQASIPEFNKIIDKIHDHNCLAVAAAFPFVIDDRLAGTHGFEDLFGGPIATVEWDYIAIMMYTSYFVEYAGSLGIDWDAAHYLAYDYAKDAKEIWGDRAAIAIGVTNPGEAQGKIMYQTPEQIADGIGAIRAAGIENVGIYDVKGILESDDPQAWFEVLAQTPARTPEKGKCKAKRFRRLIKKAGKLLESLR